MPCIKTLYTLVAIVILTACSTHSSQFTYNGHSCFPRIGNCVKASIDGQAITLIRDKSVLKPYEGKTHYLDDVEWEVVTPVTSRANVISGIRTGTDEWFGSYQDTTIEFIALEGQRVPTVSKTGTRKDVRSGGSATMVQEEVFTSENHAPGAYLFFVKVKGTKNWDRATIFVRVGE